jgi:protein involved in polysaccharide export with SLBB domain
MRTFLLLALTCLTSLSCPTCLTAQTPQTSPEYTLDTGDVLSVVVVNHPEFSSEYAVPPDGRILFHGAGELMVRGLTLKQVEAYLREALRKRLREPVVSVSLKQARPMLVFVEGQVGKPGAYPIDSRRRRAENPARTRRRPTPARERNHPARPRGALS